MPCRITMGAPPDGGARLNPADALTKPKPLSVHLGIFVWVNIRPAASQRLVSGRHRRLESVHEAAPCP